MPTPHSSETARRRVLCERILGALWLPTEVLGITYTICFPEGQTASEGLLSRSHHPEVEKQTASSPDLQPPHLVPFPLPLLLGNICWPASASTLEKWQGPHFPQRLIGGLVSLSASCNMKCVCTRTCKIHCVYFNNLLSAPNSSEIAAGIILQCPLYALWF